MTGSGTLLDPYVIWDVNDLQAVENDREAYYELGQDIDASATIGWNEGSGFKPIGWDEPFLGQLDGKEYTISALHMNWIAYPYVGLFGSIAANAVLKNINMTGADIAGGAACIGMLLGYSYSGGSESIENCHVSGTVINNNLAVYVGGLVGYYRGEAITNCSSAGTVTNEDLNPATATGGLIGYVYGSYVTGCHSSCEVSGYSAVGGFSGSTIYTMITYCYSTGDVTASGESGGGFVGSTALENQIEMCYATGNVSVAGDMGGGFAGQYSRNIPMDQCYATGNVIVGGNYGGGFIGVNQGIIMNCYASGDVNVIGDYCGGFVGLNSYPPGGSGTIGNCYSTGVPTCAGGNRGGFCGKIGGDGEVYFCFWDTETSGIAISDGGTGKTTAEMKTQSTFTDAGWDFTTVWAICSTANNRYPCLLETTPNCGLPTGMAGLNPAIAELLLD